MGHCAMEFVINGNGTYRITVTRKQLQKLLLLFAEIYIMFSA